MKIRYCKQPNNFDCGPYALVNLEKWAGAKFNGHKKKLAYRKLMGTDRDGTYDHKFVWALQKSKHVRIAHESKTDLTAINSHIDRGHALVICYDQYNPKVPGDYEGHLTICVGRTKDYYILVNDEKYNETHKQAIIYRHRNTMESMMKTAKIWVVGKKMTENS